eukprot:4144512-Alexandrium_andersonii.AAC.1
MACDATYTVAAAADQPDLITTPGPVWQRATPELARDVPAEPRGDQRGIPSHASSPSPSRVDGSPRA